MNSWRPYAKHLFGVYDVNVGRFVMFTYILFFDYKKYIHFLVNIYVNFLFLLFPILFFLLVTPPALSLRVGRPLLARFYHSFTLFISNVRCFCIVLILFFYSLFWPHSFLGINFWSLHYSVCFKCIVVHSHHYSCHVVSKRCRSAVNTGTHTHTRLIRWEGIKRNYILMKRRGRNCCMPTISPDENLYKYFENNTTWRRRRWIKKGHNKSKHLPSRITWN